MLPVMRVALAVKTGETLYPRSSPVLENNGITEGEFRDDFHADFNGLSKPL